MAVLALGQLACASAEVVSLSRGDLGRARARIDGVPFFAQADDHCGPASLAMVLRFAGDEVTPEELAGIAFTPGRRGALALDLVTATRRRGRVPYPLRPEIGALLREVRAGRPVLVLQNLGLGILPVWHYAVVIGFDVSAGTITLHTGRLRAHETSLHTFVRTWSRGGGWARVVLAPDELPETLGADETIDEMVRFERAARPEQAVAAYRAALRRWPSSEAAYVGLGNASYARGDLEAAEQAFLRALDLRPDSAPIRNNLAQVLAERGDFAGARAQIERAIEIGGARSEVYARTRREIDAREAAARRPSD